MGIGGGEEEVEVVVVGGGRAVRNGGSDGTFYLGGRRNLAGVEAAAEFDEVAALLGARPQLVHLRAVDAELLAAWSEGGGAG